MTWPWGTRYKRRDLDLLCAKAVSVGLRVQLILGDIITADGNQYDWFENHDRIALGCVRTSMRWCVEQYESGHGNIPRHFYGPSQTLGSSI